MQDKIRQAGAESSNRQTTSQSQSRDTGPTEASDERAGLELFHRFHEIECVLYELEALFALNLATMEPLWTAEYDDNGRRASGLKAIQDGLAGRLERSIDALRSAARKAGAQ